jgi:hypothetical protein
MTALFFSHTSKRLLWLCAALMLANLPLGATAAQDTDLPPLVCAVSPDGTELASGRQWSSPKSLHAALADSSCGSIWLKEGVYKPVVPVDKAAPTASERQTAFVIERPLKLYGGFQGQEVQLAQRSERVNSLGTILSGDIGDDDVQQEPMLPHITLRAMGMRFDPSQGCNGQSGNTCRPGDYFGYEMGDQRGNNSRNVVVVRASATYSPDRDNTLIDGLTITAGDADGGGNSDGRAGGGLRCEAGGPLQRCSPSLQRLMLLGNHSHGGGAAIHIEAPGQEASPLLDGVYVYGNFSSGEDTGALMLKIHDTARDFGRANALIRNTTFMGNVGTGMSGAVHILSGDSEPSTTTIEHSSFLNHHGAFEVSINGGNSQVSLNMRHSVIWGGVQYYLDRAPLPSFSFNTQREAAEDEGTTEIRVAHSVTQSCFQKPDQGHLCDANTVRSKYSGWYVVGYQMHVDTSLNPLLPANFERIGGALALLPQHNSPLLNAVACLPDVVTDALGRTRPQAPLCDIGAFERPVQTLSLQVQGPGSVSGMPNLASCTGECSTWAWTDASVTLTTTPDHGAAVLSLGSCEGSFTMAADRHCVIRFYDALQIPGLADASTTVGNVFAGPTPGAIEPIGVAGLTWQTQSSLPTGLSLTPGTGQLVGTPTQAGRFPITLTATDGQGISGSVNFALTVGKAQPTLTLPTPTVTSHAFAPDLQFALAPLASSTSSGADAGGIAYRSRTPNICSISGTQVTALQVGRCELYAEQAEGANHLAASSAIVSVQIVKGPQTLSFPPQSAPTQAYVQGGSFALSPLATSATTSSERPIVYSSLTPSVCTVTYSSITMLSAGTCSVAANQAGDANFEAATQQVQNITIAAEAQQFRGVTVPGAGGTSGVGEASFTGGGAQCHFDVQNTRFEASAADPQVAERLAQGLFRFKLQQCDTGSTVHMRITWPEPVTAYKKFGLPSPGASAPSYFDLPGVRISGNTVEFSLTDGQLGDDDWQANGVIVDPTGPWTPAASVVAVPALKGWGLLGLSACIAAVALCRRRQAQPSA